LNRPGAILVAAARAGDVDSFRGLYERYYALAVGIAQSQIFDRHLAEDAAQEAFVEVCRDIGKLRDTNRFPEWLGTICRRTAIRMARWKTKAVPILSEPVAPAQPTCGSLTKVETALAQLPVGAREVIHLHYFSGLSYDEIGRALRITPEAVHGRLQRARRVLFDLLSKPREEDY
jgi:RNA polymerase sigma-70 factor (ECF subfamily)